jgi:hypothetical protein
MRKVIPLLWCAAASLKGVAWSEDLNAVQLCPDLADDRARLACYDAAYGVRAPRIGAQSSPHSAQPAGTSAASVAPVSTASASKTTQSAGTAGAIGSTDAVGTATPPAEFGDTGQLPAERKAKAKLPKKLKATVQSVKALQGGLYVLTLDNGQVWQTQESDWQVVFKPNDVVIVSKMAFTTFQIASADGGRSVGVRRIQ